LGAWRVEGEVGWVGWWARWVGGKVHWGNDGLGTWTRWDMDKVG